jgi:anaerobic dimethyl sulfoxide reductase subunit A
LNKGHLPEDKGFITTTCSYDCGARCLLKVHVKDNRVERIISKRVEGLNISACPKGLAQKEVLYSKERILQPLKRVGKRGDKDFKTISWDEAFDVISEKMDMTVGKYGTESIYYLVNTGSLSLLHNSRAATHRFFGMLGKCTTFWGNVSFEGAVQSSLATFGTLFTGSTRDNFIHSKLIILWGWDPNVSRFGSDTSYYLKKAKKSGARIICVDPRQNHSCKDLAERWISLKPGTDTAMLIAMAYVMIDENIYDKGFIDKHTRGFGSFYDYVTGKEDGVVKDPVWASRICGTRPDDITELARLYATIRPAALATGWAPGRSAFGEQFHRAASTLAAMTANIGNKGGFVSGGTDFIDLAMIDKKIPVPETSHNMIHKTRLYDTLLNSKNTGHPPCRILYIVGCNLLNQYLNLNKGIKALAKPDFTVVHDLFLTPTVRFADIVLPVTHFLEQEDIGLPYIGGPYAIFMNKAVEPAVGPRSDLEIFSGLAKKMGLKNYNPKSDKEWMEYMLEKNPDFPGLKELKSKDTYDFKVKRPWIAFSENISGSSPRPFLTPSGKIEISSRMFENMKDPLIPAIPKYIASWEGPEDKAAKDYPIQLISPHSKARINSQLYNIEKITRLADDRLWINTEDAAKRGIRNGDTVLAYNKRGKISATAKVTDEIIKGVASIDQGQWYDNDKSNKRLTSSVNLLTLDRQSPAGAFPSNTCLVQIKKMVIKEV